MDPIVKFRSRTVVLPRENVDTDQIIPARYLKTTDKVGLGKALFSDWRYAEGGVPRPDFVLNQPGAQGARPGAGEGKRGAVAREKPLG